MNETKQKLPGYYFQNQLKQYGVRKVDLFTGGFNTGFNITNHEPLVHHDTNLFIDEKIKSQIKARLLGMISDYTEAGKGEMVFLSIPVPSRGINGFDKLVSDASPEVSVSLTDKGIIFRFFFEYAPEDISELRKMITDLNNMVDSVINDITNYGVKVDSKRVYLAAHSFNSEVYSHFFDN